MSEDSKYYVPTIEEFHIGFEYEALWGVENINGEWLKETFKEGQGISDLEVIHRVKHLDREDIEGFGEVSGHRSLLYFTNNISPPLVFTFEGSDKNMTGKIRINTAIGMEVLFNGKIKNKSELGRVLRQVGVII